MNGDLVKQLTDSLRTGAFDEVKKRLDSEFFESISEIDGSLADAVKGDRGSARTYSHAYLRLSERILQALRPDLKSEHWWFRVARREVIAIPFRACLVDDRPGLSVALTLLSDLRRTVPGASELDWPETSRPLIECLEVTDRGVARFERIVDRMVDTAAPPLEVVIDTFNLNHTETAHLFGVSRQAIPQWLADGPPVGRQAKIVTVAEVTTLLRMRLIAERIPGIARKSAEAYGGRSMLEMIADDDHERLLELTRRSFDWAVTA